MTNGKRTETLGEKDMHIVRNTECGVHMDEEGTRMGSVGTGNKAERDSKEAETIGYF